MLWRNVRMRWGPQISGLSSLAHLMFLNPKPRTKKPRWKQVKYLSGAMSHSCDTIYEKWLCYFVWSSCIKQLGLNLDFCTMNHINGHDIVSPNGHNTHHTPSNVPWENITLWANWLIQTDCIYNSPGANTFSRAKSYLQPHQEKNSIYGVHPGTALFTFKERGVWMKGCSSMAACTSPHKKHNFNS